MVLVLVGHASPLRAGDTPSLTYEDARRRIERLTGRPFRDSVPLRQQSREEFQRYVEKSLSETFNPDELEHLKQLYYLLGLFPKRYPLKQRLLELYRDQAGAYYDPRSGTIRTLAQDLPPSSRHFIYLHELMHAQQDQYFGVGDHLARIRRNATLDRQMAFQFVIEGHANLVAMASQAGASRLSEDFFRSEAFGRVVAYMARIPEIDPSRLNALAQSIMPEGSGVVARSLDQMTSVPWILVQQLMDPYFVGQKQWFERGGRLGWEEAERWLDDPPRTTRSVLYPRADTAPAVPSLKDAPGTSVYQNEPGTYLLLRWMGRLSRRPPWGRTIAVGPARVLDTGNDTVLAWRMGGDKTAREAFLRDLVQKLDPGDTETRKPGQFEGREGSRYLRIEFVNHGLVLWLDDDPRLPRGVPWSTLRRFRKSDQRSVQNAL